MKYKYGILIGRFQPVHNEHLKLIRASLGQAEKLIIIFGSHRSAPNFRNPWTAEERKAMVSACLKPEERERIIFCQVRDQMYNDDLWLTEVQQKIFEITGPCHSICLCGSYKDDTSYYLNFFPQWDFQGFPQNKSFKGATAVREAFFHDNPENDWLLMVPPPVVEWLCQFKKMEKYKYIKADYKDICDYQLLWKHAPFPPTFVTTDVVLVKSGHVLMIRRGSSPGKGLLALPGGFIGINEKIRDSAIRELYEETRIMVPRDEIRQFIKDQRVFDHPKRSLRGRTVTHSFFIRLPSGGRLPEVQANDDAIGAHWMALGDLYLKEDEIFEDHLHQIEYFTRKL